MQVRLGIPASFSRFSAAARELGAPVLVSANAFRRRGMPVFSMPSVNLFAGCNVALDSAGFVAMVLYRGYPWTVAEYVRLAASHPWAWWASMDYCCEREVAADREIVLQRMRDTVRQLKACQNAALEAGISAPMPVLQGWLPEDYVRSFEWMLPLAVPDLMGVGSVCRRPLGGPSGLMQVVTRLDRELPPGKKLHLFGVKGTAIGALAGHPRIASIDSLAWDAAARRELPDGHSATVDYRIRHMRRWYAANIAMLDEPRQLRMAL